MGDRTAIEWADATWNPLTGCTKISPGCDRCYAERFAERWRGIPSHPFTAGFDLTLRPERLDQPLRWTRPRRIFANSLSDLFHASVPRRFVDGVFDVMERADHHVFQVLTKRSSRMRLYINARYRGAAPPHIWLGVSVEDADHLWRVGHLRGTRAGMRWISFEPLIGGVGEVDLDGIDWVVAGGESGPGARKMDGRWAREIRDAAAGGGVPFNFKQWGGATAKAGGRKLDGRTHDDVPMLAGGK